MIGLFILLGGITLFATIVVVLDGSHIVVGIGAPSRFR
jgi:hypothetical protein